MKYTLLLFYIFLLKGNLSSSLHNADITVPSIDIMEKYGKRVSSNGYVFFNAKEFNEEEKIYFKLTCEYGFYGYEFLEYMYFSDYNDFIATYNSKMAKRTDHTSKNDKEDSNGNIIETVAKYTIEKDKGQYDNSNGDLLLLGFYCGGKGEIENIKKEEVSTIVLAVVFSIIGVAIIVFLIIYCYKRKKAQSQQIAANTLQANVANTPYPYPQNNMNNFNQNQNYNMPSNVNMNMNMNGYNQNHFNKY